MRELETFAEYVLEHVRKGTLSSAMAHEFTEQCCRIVCEEEAVQWTGRVKELWDYLTVSQSAAAGENGAEGGAFLQGRLYAAMEIVKIFQDERMGEQVLRTDAAEYSKHWYAVFSALKGGRSLTHGELAERSRLSDSSLSQFLHKIENKRYIQFRKVGRTKYYRLSSRGQELLKYMESELGAGQTVYKSYPGMSNSINTWQVGKTFLQLVENGIIENGSRNEYVKTVNTKKIYDAPVQAWEENRYREVDLSVE